MLLLKIKKTVEDNFGVFLIPKPMTTEFAMTFMHYMAVEEVPKAYQHVFIECVNSFSFELYKELGLDMLLCEFLGKSFDKESELKLRDKVYEYIELHENITKSKVTQQLSYLIAEAIQREEGRVTCLKKIGTS